VTLWIDSTLVLMILTNLMLLGSSRLRTCIRVVSMQGLIAGLLALGARGGPPSPHMILLALGGMGLKGFLFPWLLFRARRQANVRRETHPLLGYQASILVGVVAMGVSLWLGARLPLPENVISSLAVPTALFTIFAGLILIVGRRTALLQVIGYLVLENGIYAFGVAVVHEAPLLVEMGVLLDLFVAVFVMGITIFHISRTFDHIETDRLASLRE